jgi:hypothetical protein
LKKEYICFKYEAGAFPPAGGQDSFSTTYAVAIRRSSITYMLRGARGVMVNKMKNK